LAEFQKKQINNEAFLNREELIEKYKYYVYSIVKKVRATMPKTVDFEELVSYGMIGLMEAADRYDPRRGVSFTTFSYYRIRGAIFDGLRDMGILKRTSQGKWVQKEANLNDLTKTALDDSGPANQTVNDEIREVGKLVDKLIPAYLLSLSDETTPEIADSTELPSSLLEMEDLAGLVKNEVNKLTEKEQQLLINLYFKGISTTKLAKMMGISKSWVSRLHAKAIGNLRDKLIKTGVIHPPD
jgi:RNA polymerase sigma factor for flagellar operon FliA